MIIGSIKKTNKKQKSDTCILPFNKYHCLVNKKLFLKNFQNMHHDVRFVVPIMGYIEYSLIYVLFDRHSFSKPWFPKNSEYI